MIFARVVNFWNGMSFWCYQKDTLSTFQLQKNHFASDICIDKDTPFLATSKDVIKFIIGKYNTTDEIENDMMAVRWHVFNFAQPIACHKRKDMHLVVSALQHLFSQDLS